MARAGQRARVKVGRKIAHAAEWEALAGAVATLARTFQTTITVCHTTKGEAVIVIGSDGSRLTPVATVMGGEQRARIESTWRLKRDGYALYRQAVPVAVGRPSDRLGSRTAPRIKPPEDGPVYTPEQRAALRKELGLED